jgi:hypothetical protein
MSEMKTAIMTQKRGEKEADEKPQLTLKERKG